MDRYSRRVAFFKVMLPLAAVGLLSTLFLLSRKVDPDASIPFADRDIEERLRNQQITAPTYTGVSKNGDDLYITASTVSPPIGDMPAKATDLVGQLQNQDGQVIHLSASLGTLEDKIGRATFIQDVVIETSSGYVMRTNLLTARLDQSTAHAPQDVYGTGPFGDFKAGSMEIEPKIGSKQLHILFTNGVRLIYEPKQTER